ncbi:MAG: hypothetical protein U0641_09095 [Anaerolineae bacterium]
MGKHTTTRSAPASPVAVSLADIIVCLPIASAAIVILVSYLLDLAGWPIAPGPVLGLALLGVALAVFTMWRWGPPFQVRAAWGELAGLAVVLVSFPLYAYWLGGQTWLPANGSTDTPHHITLINFIQTRASLPHAPDLAGYLGEFATYSPGSHILAALVGRAFGVVGVAIVEPVVVAAAALRIAVFYLIALRLLPPRRARPLLALAGAALLLVAYWYVINSFLYFFFYAQVISELFALAMLWALVAWNDEGRRGALAFFSLCGIGVWLTWPMWLPAPTLALAGLLLLRRDLLWRRRATTFALTMLPIAVVAIAYTAERVHALAILAAEGAVTRASVTALGWPLLLLAGVGMMVSLRRANMRPVWLFAAILLAQTAMLAVLDTLHRVQTYYQTYKMFYLLVYPLALFATVGLAYLWQRAATRWPRVGLPLAAALPPLALALALWNGLPLQPVATREQTTAFTPPLSSSVVWARQNLPPACVDYLVNYWVTAYWLHLELGNPRATDHSTEIVEHYDDRVNSPDRWKRPRGLPYAIVENMDSVPENVRSRFTVLYDAPPSAVVYRTGECDEAIVPLQDYPLPPRTDTLAARLDRLLGARLAGD